MTVTWHGLTLTVEAALSAATGSYGVWDSAVWDTGTWGPDDVWTDISLFVREIRTSRKFARDRTGWAWESGQADVLLDNSDGRFSPDNPSSPYIVSGVTGVRPWRKLRIKIGVFPLYTGYVLRWPESYSRAHAVTVVTAQCVDELASLNRFDGFETEAQGGGELSGLRIHRVLNNAGHTGERAIDPGRFTVQATTLAQPAVTELKLTADSEGGALWVEADGSLWYENRYALLENSRSRIVQATFGDGSNPVELPCTNIETEYDGERVDNIAAFARAGGTAQTFDDATSRALYGDSRYSRSDLILESDADVAGLSELHVRLHKDAERRIVAITFRPLHPRYPIMVLHAAGRKVRDLIHVNVRPKGGHTISQDSHISGISHVITREDWQVTYDLTSAEPWSDFTGSLWDSAVWDTGTWFI